MYMPLTEKGRKLIKEMNQALAEERSFTPPCPVDNLPGTFLRPIGSSRGGFNVYVCPNGDQFTFNTETKKGQLLPPRYRKGE